MPKSIQAYGIHKKKVQRGKTNDDFLTVGVCTMLWKNWSTIALKLSSKKTKCFKEFVAIRIAFVRYATDVLQCRYENPANGAYRELRTWAAWDESRNHIFSQR